VDTSIYSIYGYRKEVKMIFEHDPERPFSNIVVKNGPSIVGTIRRHFETGLYHFYDNQRGTLNSLLQARRIESMKSKIEGLFSLSEAS
jgi:hypothetical protein